MKAARRVLIAAGVLIVGYAVAGALTDPGVTPLGILLFLGGVLVGHEGVLLPLVIGVGVIISRYVPAPERGIVRVAALCSLAVTIVAIPFVLGYGIVADNPSVLPLAYGRALVIVLGLIWTAALATTVVRRIRKHGGRSSPTDHNSRPQ